ncbi:Ribonuclease H-like superfamily [Sesbania bispinosa]|nr:Ribonuclease H-like superfamily [Sesbania bispinosa]
MEEENKEKERAHFLWSGNSTHRGWHLVGWEKIITPRKQGGLGVWSARLANISLLGKLLWALLQGEDKLWVQVFTAKYSSNASILGAPVSNGSSHIWKSIVKAKVALRDGFNFRIGDGASSVWYCDWSGHGKLCNMVPYVHISDTTLCLQDLLVDNNWELSAIHIPLPPFVSDLFNLIRPVCVPSLSDCWLWTGNSNGVYSTSSGYAWLIDKELDLRHQRDHFNWVWKLHCPDKRILSIALEIVLMLWKSGLTWVLLAPMIFLILRVVSWLRLNFKSDHGTLFLATIWWLWRWRNNMCLDERKRSLEFVLRSISLANDEFLKFLSPQGRSLLADVRLAYWCPPPKNHWVSGFSGFIGLGDVLEAEFMAFFMGLQASWLKGFKAVVVESNSLEVVSELLNGFSAPTHLYSQLIADIRQLLTRDWVVELRHVYREANRASD